MKFPLVTLLLLTLLACSGESRLPLAPRPPDPPPQLASLWPVVFEEGTDQCILGAKVEIVVGPGTGQSLIQDGWCDLYYQNPDHAFRDLTPDAWMILRASASGYAAKEIEVFLTACPCPPTPISLSRAP